MYLTPKDYVVCVETLIILIWALYHIASIIERSVRHYQRKKRLRNVEYNRQRFKEIAAVTRELHEIKGAQDFDDALEAITEAASEPHEASNQN